MSNVAQNDLQPDLANFRTGDTALHRRRSIRVLFILHQGEVVDDCLCELKKAQFIVSADVVFTLAQCTEQLRSHSYDVLVVEYPSSGCKGSEALQLLHQTAQQTPLIFVTASPGSESLAELTAHGAFHYVEREHVAQLPFAVRQALNEKKLREELEGARKSLRHSQSLYRALVDNPTYGIYRCNAEGKIVDANQALISMLGCSTKEELLAANHLTELLPNLSAGPPWGARSRETLQIEPVETEWKRKNGEMLKVRISGRAVFDDYGNFAGHEIIAVDIKSNARSRTNYATRHRPIH
jgi:PAS domain S-box-containing protein